MRIWREPGGNRTRDAAIPKAGAQTTRQLSNDHSRAAKATKFARRHSESASTRTIATKGSPRSRQIRTAPQRERFDTHDLRRRFPALKTNSHFDTHDLRGGFAEVKPNSHGAPARALRRARSPQRVRRGQDKFARRHSESASTRTISAQRPPRLRQTRTAPQQERFDTHNLRRGFAEVKPNSNGATARALRHVSAEGSPRSRQIRTAPPRERFDTQNLRRGFAAVKTNSPGAPARALRHARSPQRVRRGQDKFARCHSESASTRRISAEGSPCLRQLRTAPQRERFHTHDLRSGFAAVKTNSHGVTARARRHARSPQTVRRSLKVQK